MSDAGYQNLWSGIMANENIEEIVISIYFNLKISIGNNNVSSYNIPLLAANSDTTSLKKLDLCNIYYIYIYIYADNSYILGEYGAEKNDPKLILELIDKSKLKEINIGYSGIDKHYMALSNVREERKEFSESLKRNKHLISFKCNYI